MASFHGSKKVITLCNLYGSIKINAMIAGIPTTLPVSKKCQNLHPAVIIITAQIPIITMELLKCGSNNKRPIIGANKHMCLINPLVYKFN